MLLCLGVASSAAARVQEFFANLDDGQKVIFRIYEDLPSRPSYYSFSFFQALNQKEILLFEMDSHPRFKDGFSISGPASFLGSAYVEGDRVSILVLEVQSGMHLICKRIHEGLAGSTEMSHFSGEVGEYVGKKIRLLGLHTIEIRGQDDPPDAKPKILSMNEGPDWYFNCRNTPIWSLNGEPCPQVMTGIGRFIRNDDGTTDLLPAPEFKPAADFVAASQIPAHSPERLTPKVSPASEPATSNAAAANSDDDAVEVGRLPLFIIFSVFVLLVILVWHLRTK